MPVGSRAFVAGFRTLSSRAVVARVPDGAELGSAVHESRTLTRIGVSQ